MIRPVWIERTRKLPYSGQISVRPGDWVDERQSIGRLDYIPGAMRRVDATAQLRVEGRALRRLMRVQKGEAVAPGEALAVSSCFGERRAVCAPCGGFVGLVSRTLGHVYVREPVPVGGEESVTLPVAELLQVGPLRLRDCLRVLVGTTVIPGQVIAVKRAGLTDQMVQSPIYGRVVDISQGRVTVAPSHARTEIGAYLAGRVVRVQPGQSATIRAYAYRIAGEYGVGGEAGGPLLIAGRPDAVLPAAAVTAEWRGRVVVGGWTVEPPTLRLAAAAGARAMILGYLSLDALLQYAGQSRAVGLTGDEDVPMTVVLLDGFLPTPLSGRTWESLRALAGRYAAVNGATHIRAGVIRPEVIVCERQWPAATELLEPAAGGELTVGGGVRVLRAPLIGRTGRVEQLPTERQRIATGSYVRVALVRIQGQLYPVPVSNLQPWLEEE